MGDGGVLSKLLSTKLNPELIEWVSEAFRLSVHIAEVVLHNERFQEERITPYTYKKLRVFYILKKIDNNKLLSDIKRNEKLREKRRELFCILEMLSMNINVLVSQFKYVNKLDEFENILVQLQNLCTYTNENFKKVGEIYMNKVPKIDADWNLIFPKNYPRDFNFKSECKI